jgi:hypothetical protein
LQLASVRAVRAEAFAALTFGCFDLRWVKAARALGIEARV